MPLNIISVSYKGFLIEWILPSDRVFFQLVDLIFLKKIWNIFFLTGIWCLLIRVVGSYTVSCLSVVKFSESHFYDWLKENIFKESLFFNTQTCVRNGPELEASETEDKHQGRFYKNVSFLNWHENSSKCSINITRPGIQATFGDLRPV